MVMAGATLTTAGLMVIVTLWVASGAVPLVASMVAVYPPAVVGVPVITPLVLKFSPGGRPPEITLKVGAGVPVSV